MIYQFDFRLFSQKFTHPIITNYGIWETRESIIIRLIDEDHNITWGEISPLSWFGSETITQAESFCIQLPKKITKDIILNIPDNLPSCQFAFESALQKFPDEIILNLAYSGLLPTGKKALSQLTNLYEKGYKTFKWKIAVNDINEELEILKTLVSQLPTAAKLRLDANGGLTYSQAKLWLEACDHYLDKVEFIEQPLGVDRFLEMQELSNNYYTAIALDESIANLKQIEHCVQQGWPGIFVIKPAIIGSPCKLRQFIKQHPIDVVFSSVFETNIGRNAALQLASEVYQNLPKHRAVGFGTHHFFQQEQNWLQMLWNN
ncbi:o-succinylbenzoate synthase [Anabaena sp. FACHB-1237]|uniref:o-succinylbenzoate synthase n=1 Tax=Anabaena sp. FACHB-1237 TaxID=2692769 RepID=UPI001680982C|nr:o-succinylbenzoate synthase [Anabaena sp. FACHB-1237]MBD2138910.1 o-succinylbenzoate synthase [Anabaena sp. FACHB-1237]